MISLYQALAGGQTKEPVNKTARVEVDLTLILLLIMQRIQVKDRPRGFGRGLAAEKIIGMRFSESNSSEALQNASTFSL